VGFAEYAEEIAIAKSEHSDLMVLHKIFSSTTLIGNRPFVPASRSAQSSSSPADGRLGSAGYELEPESPVAVVSPGPDSHLGDRAKRILLAGSDLR